MRPLDLISQLACEESTCASLRYGEGCQAKQVRLLLWSCGAIATSPPAWSDRDLFALFTGHERAPSLACAPAAVEEKEEEKQGGAAGPAAARAPVTPREEQVGSRFVSGRVYGADRPETGS